MSNFLQAANHTDPKNPLSHQQAAWNWAWGCLTEEERKEFLEIFRSAVPSKVEDAPNTWAGVLRVAQGAGARFPELVAAQWALESGWGKHVSGKNNFFGLKGDGTKTETKEFVNGKEITINAEFIDFPDLETCVQYLVDRWHKDWKSYKGVNNAKDRNAAAKMLVSEKYATDPKYAEKLTKIMNEYAKKNESISLPPKPEFEKQTAKLSPTSSFSSGLTPHIRLGEFALNQEARRFKHQYQVDVAAELAAFMERCRRYFGDKPIVITSGYRPAAINNSVGGASNSEHLYSEPGVGAVDFYIQGADINAVEKWIDKEWPYSLGYGAKKGFHHIGIRRGRPRVRWDY